MRRRMFDDLGLYVGLMMVGGSDMPPTALRSTAESLLCYSKSMEWERKHRNSIEEGSVSRISKVKLAHQVGPRNAPRAAWRSREGQRPADGPKTGKDIGFETD